MTGVTFELAVFANDKRGYPKTYSLIYKTITGKANLYIIERTALDAHERKQIERLQRQSKKGYSQRFWKKDSKEIIKED